ncbi:hypothetical protein L798_05019 [Zootermopsis nevadensis]|uniref:Uncharacterized protein n=1 Tax=Zootermopsis nevadensis TaxID=136037 RepID=A0A067RJR8_ZOONE|nr:hypothetical protein L798_05019 [Zootermopsis nevadensis]
MIGFNWLRTGTDVRVLSFGFHKSRTSLVIKDEFQTFDAPNGLAVCLPSLVTKCALKGLPDLIHGDICARCVLLMNQELATPTLRLDIFAEAVRHFCTYPRLQAKW